MAIIETRAPYEFLARWDESTGAFRGAHIQFFDAVERGGVRISGAPSRAYSVGEGMAFPLSDIMSTITSDALAHCDTQAAEILALKAKVADLEAQVSKLEADLGIQKAAEVNGVPQVVSMRQARLALLQAGLLAGIEAAIAGLPEPQKTAALIEWEYSSEVHRDKVFVQTLGAALGLPGAALDALFIAASKL